MNINLKGDQAFVDSACTTPLTKLTGKVADLDSVTFHAIDKTYSHLKVNPWPFSERSGSFDVDQGGKKTFKVDHDNDEECALTGDGLTAAAVFSTVEGGAEETYKLSRGDCDDPTSPGVVMYPG